MLSNKEFVFLSKWIFARSQNLMVLKQFPCVLSHYKAAE